MEKLAIVGMGPRGLYALENLLIQLEKSNKQIEILIFEISDTLGAGNVWHTEQPNSNWINITERELDGIKARPKINYARLKIGNFPSYHDWCGFSQNETQPDTFPPRHKLGKYLNERFMSIAKSLKTLRTFKIIKEEVEHIRFENTKLIVSSTTNKWTCNAIVLTIGHQPTELSDQLKAWKSHAETQNEFQVFEEPYPVTQLQSIKNKTKITIGIRGFGLAMIDVMRYLVINNFGNFKVTDQSDLETVYYKSKKQNLTIVPFSLDGLPLAPKPLNKTIDNWYKPTPEELESFKTEIEAVAKTGKHVESIDFFITPIVEIASRVFMDLKERAIEHSSNSSEIKDVISKWLDDMNYEHELLQDERISTYKLIQKYINMALGEIPISLDFCVGQVWRHCQPTLYEAFSHAKVNNEIIENVIAQDERSKRYSYGPPIESMQQILALVDAEILKLDFVTDPDIEFTKEGWQLKNERNETIKCSVMINSVLDAPKLLDIASPLVKNLLQDKLIQPIHSELGIETTDDGYVITPKAINNVPIAVLGRLAKGSVIGVDAILECFGTRITDWAKAYVAKLD